MECLSAEVLHGKTLGGESVFKVYFNGAFVKIIKSWKSIQRKLNQLISDYDLIEVAQYQQFAFYGIDHQ